MEKPVVLYISYDGMLEPLGQSQVLAYLKGLSYDHVFHLISFEKPADKAQTAKFAAMQVWLSTMGIIWHPLTYHKRPTLPATLFDIAHGTIMSLRLTKKFRIRIIHARSYVPALMGTIVKALFGTKLLFDMRGLWADERVDGGLWPKAGRLYRTVKWIEKKLLLSADHIVTLTHASRTIIAKFPYLEAAPHAPITIIPTCADLSHFRPNGSAKVVPFTLGYLGSIGTWYLFEEVLACFRLLQKKRPDARLLVVNRNEQDLVREQVKAAGIAQDSVEILAAEHADVPAQIRRMSAGAAIIRPVYSKIASAPTKLAEYLGCGVPCLGNVGVGDMASILEDENTGVAIRAFNEDERKRAVDRLLALADDPATPERCRSVAQKYFAVEDGIARYRAIYRELMR